MSSKASTNPPTSIPRECEPEHEAGDTQDRLQGEELLRVQSSHAGRREPDLELVGLTLRRQPQSDTAQQRDDRLHEAGPLLDRRTSCLLGGCVADDTAERGAPLRRGPEGDVESKHERDGEENRAESEQHQVIP